MSPPHEKKVRILGDATNSRCFAAPVSPTSLEKATKGVVPAQGGCDKHHVQQYLLSQVQKYIQFSVNAFRVTAPDSCKFWVF